MSEENLYQRGGIWWLRAVVGGRKYRESLRTGDVRTARKLRDQRIEEIKAAVYRGERRITWREAVTAWIEHAAGQIAPSTATRYGVSLLQCEPWLIKFDVDKIDGKVISDLITGRRRAGAKPATVRRDLTAVSRVLDHAEACGWREGNPILSKRRLLKERRDPIVLPEPEDIEAVIASASPRFGALIRAALLTGCRQDELVTATWRAFSDAQRTLQVRGKGNKLRTIELSLAAWTHIRTQPRTLGRTGLIFCHEGGATFAEAASDFTHVRRAALSLAKKQGRELARFRFHDLRHVFAVWALRDGAMDIYTLSRHLGHTSVKTTEIYLAYLTPSQAEAAKHGVGTKEDTATAVLPTGTRVNR